MKNVIITLAVGVTSLLLPMAMPGNSFSKVPRPYFVDAITASSNSFNLQEPPVGLCECDAVILGEAASGADVETPLIDSGSTPYTGTATLINHGELRGICNLGPDSICTNQEKDCSWNLAMKVTITAGSIGEIPAYFQIGGIQTPLISQGNGVYSATSSTSGFKVGCELSRTVTVRVRGATGTLLAEASFTLKCLDCPAAGM